MIKLLKYIFLIIIVGVANFLLSILYLSSTNLPGGEVGMLPFLILIYSLIGLIIGTIVYILLELKYKLSLTKYIWIYQIIYTLILIYYKTNPFDSRFEGILNNWDLWIYLISIIVTLSITFLYWIYKTQIDQKDRT